MATWNSAFLLNPKSSDTPTQGDDEIRTLRAAIQERIKNEHTTYAADATGGVAALDWLHKAGSAIAYYLATGSAPAVGLSGSPLKGGALWYDATLDCLKVWNPTFSQWDVIASDVIGAAEHRHALQSLGDSHLLTSVVILSWTLGDYWSAPANHGLTFSKIRSTAVSAIDNDPVDMIRVTATTVAAHVTIPAGGDRTGYAVIHSIP